jgi:hypothetical protein
MKLRIFQAKAHQPERLSLPPTRDVNTSDLAALRPDYEALWANACEDDAQLYRLDATDAGFLTMRGLSGGNGSTVLQRTQY